MTSQGRRQSRTCGNISA